MKKLSKLTEGILGILQEEILQETRRKKMKVLKICLKI